MFACQAKGIVLFVLLLSLLSLKHGGGGVANAYVLEDATITTSLHQTMGSVDGSHDVVIIRRCTVLPNVSIVIDFGPLMKAAEKPSTVSTRMRVDVTIEHNAFHPTSFLWVGAASNQSAVARIANSSNYIPPSTATNGNCDRITGTTHGNSDTTGLVCLGINIDVNSNTFNNSLMFLANMNDVSSTTSSMYQLRTFSKVNIAENDGALTTPITSVVGAAGGVLLPSLLGGMPEQWSKLTVAGSLHVASALVGFNVSVLSLVVRANRLSCDTSLHSDVATRCLQLRQVSVPLLGGLDVLQNTVSAVGVSSVSALLWQTEGTFVVRGSSKVDVSGNTLAATATSGNVAVCLYFVMPSLTITNSGTMVIRGNTLIGVGASSVVLGMWLRGSTTVDGGFSEQGSDTRLVIDLNQITVSGKDNIAGVRWDDVSVDGSYDPWLLRRLRPAVVVGAVFEFASNIVEARGPVGYVYGVYCYGAARIRREGVLYLSNNSITAGPTTGGSSLRHVWGVLWGGGLVVVQSSTLRVQQCNIRSEGNRDVIGMAFAGLINVSTHSTLQVEDTVIRSIAPSGSGGTATTVELQATPVSLWCAEGGQFVFIRSTIGVSGGQVTGTRVSGAIYLLYQSQIRFDKVDFDVDGAVATSFGTPLLVDGDLVLNPGTLGDGTLAFAQTCSPSPSATFAQFHVVNSSFNVKVPFRSIFVPPTSSSLPDCHIAFRGLVFNPPPQHTTTLAPVATNSSGSNDTVIVCPPVVPQYSISVAHTNFFSGGIPANSLVLGYKSVGAAPAAGGVLLNLQCNRAGNVPSSSPTLISDYATVVVPTKLLLVDPSRLTLATDSVVCSGCPVVSAPLTQHANVSLLSTWCNPLGALQVDLRSCACRCSQEAGGARCDSIGFPTASHSATLSHTASASGSASISPSETAQTASLSNPSATLSKNTQSPARTVSKGTKTSSLTLLISGTESQMPTLTVSTSQPGDESYLLLADGLTLVLSWAMPVQAAQLSAAVVTVSGLAAGVLFAPPAAATVARLGFVGGQAACAPAEHRGAFLPLLLGWTNQEPERRENPLQFHLPDSQWPRLAGGLVLTAIVFALLPVFLWMALWALIERCSPPSLQPRIRSRRGRRVKEEVKSSPLLHRFLQFVVASGCAVVISLFVPITVKSAVFLLSHTPSDNGTDVGNALAFLIVAAGIIVVCGRFSVLVFTDEVVIQFVRSPNVKDTGQQSLSFQLHRKISDSLFVEAMTPQVLAVRSPWDAHHRAWFIQELLVSVLLGMLDGLRPTTLPSCIVNSSLSTLVLILHIAYLLKVRPLRRRLEQIYFLYSSMLLLLCSLLGLITTVQLTSDPESRRSIEVMPLQALLAWLFIIGLCSVIAYFLLALVFGPIASLRRPKETDQVEETPSQSLDMSGRSTSPPPMSFLLPKQGLSPEHLEQHRALLKYAKRKGPKVSREIVFMEEGVDGRGTTVQSPFFVNHSCVRIPTNPLGVHREVQFDLSHLAEQTDERAEEFDATQVDESIRTVLTHKLGARLDAQVVDFSAALDMLSELAFAGGVQPASEEEEFHRERDLCRCTAQFLQSWLSGEGGVSQRLMVKSSLHQAAATSALDENAAQLKAIEEQHEFHSPQRWELPKAAESTLRNCPSTADVMEKLAQLRTVVAVRKSLAMRVAEATSPLLVDPSVLPVDARITANDEWGEEMAQLMQLRGENEAAVARSNYELL